MKDMKPYNIIYLGCVDGFVIDMFVFLSKEFCKQRYVFIWPEKDPNLPI